MALNFLLDILFPKFCFGCLKIGTYLCFSCLNKIVFTKITLCPYCEKPSPYSFTHPKCKTKFGIDGLFVLGDYSGILRKIIHFYKYKNVFSLVEDLVKLLIINLSTGITRFDLVTSIPLHKTRLLERGYNQAEILAKLLARKRNIIYKNVLIRKKSTLPQMSISKYSLRRKNMRNVFKVFDKNEVFGKSICLIDDVATTGATIFEAAKVLKKNGAKSVWGIVLARKLPNF